MKLSRFQPIYNGLNGVAKKIYDVVPISAPWSTHKMMKELERKGSHIDLKAVQGCLGFMLSVGIIERNKDGDYIRTEIKIANRSTPDDDSDVKPPTQEEILMATAQPKTSAPVTAAAKSTVFDVLVNLSKRIGDISDMADELKKDIENAAIQAQTELDKDATELAKLRQLKALLGSLND